MIIEGIDSVSIAVTDAKVSAKFYSELFGFEIEDDSNPKSIILSLEPTRLRLLQVEKVANQLSASNLPILSFVMDEDDFTDAISEIEEKGIKIVKGPEATSKGESLILGDPDQNLIEIFYLA